MPARRRPLKKKTAPTKLAWLRRGGFRLLSAGVISLTLFIFSIYLGFWGPVPGEEELSRIEQSQASLVYDQHGELIGSYFQVNRDPVSYADLPQHLVQALVATEDERFYQHSGIDWRSLFRVFFKTLLLGDESAGGGSTLTQQLAKNLYGRADFGAISMPVNKFREMIIATRLERLYSKEQILALYLNTVSFSENTYGIAAGSGRFFNVPPKNLKAEESAVLIGLLKANTYYNPRLYPERSIARRNVVFQQMLRNDFVDSATCDSLQGLPLVLNYRNFQREGPASYFLAKVEKELEQLLADQVKPDGSPWSLKQDGLRVHTTLDAAKQKALQASFQNHLANWQKKFNAHWSNREPWHKKPLFFERALMRTPYYQQLAAQGLSDEQIRKELERPRNMELYHPAGPLSGSFSMVDSLAHYLKILRGASVLLNPKNGAIEAWLGGPDYRHLPFDAAAASHTMASTIKPFIMAAALEQGANPCELRSAERRAYPEHQNWSPQNYDGNYQGLFSMKGALKRSVNTVTVAWYFEAGAEKVRDFVTQLGLGASWPQGPTASLGVAAVSPLELAVAYAAFANGGMKVAPYSIERIETFDGRLLYQHQSTKAERVMKEETAALINDMLMEVSEDGTAASLRSRYGAKKDWAAKTGTSQDYADAWLLAYRPNLVSSTWMGGVNPLIRFRSGRYGSGSTMALPVLGGFIAAYESKIPLASWPGQGPEIKAQLDCPDYREETIIDGLKSIFKSKEGEKVPSDDDPWWKKIFRKD